MAGIFGGTIRAYNPTPAEKAGYWAYDLARKLGAGKYAAQTAQNNIRDIVGMVPGLGVGDYLARKATGQTGGTTGFEAGLDAAGVAPVGKAVAAVAKPLAVAAKPIAGMFGKAALAKAPALAMFLGVGAKNADLAALKTAEKMASQGADRRAIWDATGWFKGTDDKWRFEIDDSAANFSRKPTEVDLKKRKIIGKSFSHPELYSAYDDASNIQLMPGYGMNGYAADYRPELDTIRLEASRLNARPIKDAKSSILHELQHAIQAREGFATGGNMMTLVPDNYDALVQRRIDMFGTGQSVTKAADDWYNSPAGWRSGAKYEDVPKELITPEFAEYMSLSKQIEDMQKIGAQNYKNLAGEVEARNVQSRMSIPMSGRRIIPPWETQDVPFEQQIVRFGK